MSWEVESFSILGSVRPSDVTDFLPRFFYFFFEEERKVRTLFLNLMIPVTVMYNLENISAMFDMFV